MTELNNVIFKVRFPQEKQVKELPLRSIAIKYGERSDLTIVFAELDGNGVVYVIEGRYALPSTVPARLAERLWQTAPGDQFSYRNQQFHRLTTKEMRSYVRGATFRLELEA